MKTVIVKSVYRFNQQIYSIIVSITVECITYIQRYTFCISFEVSRLYSYTQKTQEMTVIVIQTNLIGTHPTKY